MKIVKALVNLEILLFAVEEGMLNKEWPGPVERDKFVFKPFQTYRFTKFHQ